MVQSLLLIEGKTVKKEALHISLQNAKQLIFDNAPGFGFILHVSATTAADLSKAIVDFSKVAGVTSVITLALRNT